MPGIVPPPRPATQGQGDEPNFSKVAGLFWPQGDPGKLRQAAQAWREMGTALTTAEGTCRGAGRLVVGSNEGPAIDAFGRYWSRWQGGSGYFELSSQSCGQMAEALDRYADAIDQARQKVEEIAATAATVLAVGLVLTVVTVGISDAAAGLAAGGLAAAAAAVGVELSTTVATIGGTILAGAAIGAAASVVVDTAVQIEHIDLFHDQQSFNWDELEQSLGIGALTGGVGAGVGLGARAAAPLLEDGLPGFSKATNAFAKMPDATRALVRGSLVGGATAAGVDELTTGQVDPLDVALGATSGATGDVAVRGAYAPGTRLAILRGRAVDLVSSRLGITDPAARQALGQAYDVTARYSAPFMTKVAGDMLVDLKAEVAANPDRSIVLVGRDGHSLAVAMRPLDPQFVDHNTHEVVLSRAVVDGAIQDVETNTGRTFPDIEGFRRAAGQVSPEDIDGSMQRLTEYLQNSGVPVGRPGSEVTLVDTSYKGTVQELLSAAYPDTSFQGRFVFFGASPTDPHPGTKVGYALHLEVDQGSTGIPLDHLPGDPRLTFAHQDAIATIEETLHGPLDSPRVIGPDGPVQQLQRLDPEPLRGLNPVGVQDIYSDPLVREGVKHINLVAVHDYAQHVADVRTLGGDWQGQLDQGSAGFQHQVRAWIGGGDVDPRFANVMDSFVRRSDKGLVASLQTAIDHAGLTSDQATAVWTNYDHLGTLPDRQAFVNHFRLEHP